MKAEDLSKARGLYERWRACEQVLTSVEFHSAGIAAVVRLDKCMTISNIKIGIHSEELRSALLPIQKNLEKEMAALGVVPFWEEVSA